jgi:hypothetical protein
METLTDNQFYVIENKTFSLTAYYSTSIIKILDSYTLVEIFLS